MIALGNVVQYWTIVFLSWIVPVYQCLSCSARKVDTEPNSGHSGSGSGSKVLNLSWSGDYMLANTTKGHPCEGGTAD